MWQVDLSAATFLRLIPVMLNRNYLYLLSFFLLLLTTLCKAKYDGLRKLTYDELFIRVANVVIDPESVIYKDVHGNGIHKSDLHHFNRDSFALDKFVDKSDTVRLCIVRRIKNEDIVLRKKSQKLYEDSVELKIIWIKRTVKDSTLQKEMIDMACYTAPIKPVKIDCDSIKYLLQNMFSSDQNNRTRETIDWKIDRRNQVLAVSIIEQCGFLSIEELSGDEGIFSLFMIVQHANKHFRDKYFPYFREKAIQGKLDRSLLSLMEDRILIEQGKRQKYGTQVRKLQNAAGYELYPIEDPENVDKLREEVGLNPMNEYLRRFNIDWEKYLKEIKSSSNN